MKSCLEKYGVGEHFLPGETMPMFGDENDDESDEEVTAL